MRKILIAIDNNFIRESYSDVFKREKFNVLETKDGKQALSLAGREKPDIILVDILLSPIGGFELLEELKKKDSTARIPVIVFAHQEKEEDRIRAMKLAARDFITSTDISPLEVTRRVKIALGDQKSYRVKITKNLDLKSLLKDLGLDPSLKCPKCDSNLELYLIRDLLAGENHFIVSFVCPKCD